MEEEDKPYQTFISLDSSDSDDSPAGQAKEQELQQIGDTERPLSFALELKAPQQSMDSQATYEHAKAGDS